MSQNEKSDLDWVLETPDLYWVPRRAEIARGIRAGMPVVANEVQEHFQLYDDDGDESTSTSKIAKDTNGNVNVDSGDVDTQMRFCVQQTATGHNESTTRRLTLFAAKNGGSYTEVTPARSDGIAAYSSSNLVSGDDTTERLAGSGTFITNNNWEADGGLCGTITWPNESGSVDEAETVWPVRFVQADAANGDYFDFELRDSAGTALSGGYTRRPRYTIVKSGQTMTGTVVTQAGVAYDGVLAAVEEIVGALVTQDGVAYDGTLAAVAFLTGLLVTQDGVAYDGVLDPGNVNAVQDAAVDVAGVAYDGTIIYDQVLTGTVVNQPPVAYDGVIAQPRAEVYYASLEVPDRGAVNQTIYGAVAWAEGWAHDALAIGVQEITGGDVDQAAVAYDGVLVPGNVDLVGTVAEQAGVAYDGTLAAIATILGAVIEQAGVAYDGTLASVATLTGTVAEQAGVAYDGVLDIGAAPLTGTVVNQAAVAYDGVLAPGNVNITGDDVDQAGIAYAGFLVAGGAGTLQGVVVDQPGVAYDGVLVPGPRTLTGTLVTQDGVAYDATLYSQAFLIPDGPVILPREAFDATLVPGPLTITGATVDQPAVAYDGYIPRIATGPTVDSPATAYDGVLVPGEVVITGSTPDVPAVAYDGGLTPGGVILTGTVVDQAGIAYDAVVYAVATLIGLVVEVAAVSYQGNILGGDQEVFTLLEDVAHGHLRREDVRTFALRREDRAHGTLQREDDR
jgi:hypothetical protein